MEHSYRVYLHNVPCWLFIFKWNSMEAPSKHPHHGNTIIIYPPTHTYRFYCHPPHSLSAPSTTLLSYRLSNMIQVVSATKVGEDRSRQIPILIMTIMATPLLSHGIGLHRLK